MTQGPSLNTARKWHGCEKLNDGSIIVAGGVNYDELGASNKLSSTEILRIGEQKWTNGPSLEDHVDFNTLITIMACKE